MTSLFSRNEMTKTEWLKTILTEPRFTEWFFRLLILSRNLILLRNENVVRNWKLGKISQNREKFLCEILFWFNPQKSLAYLSLFNIFIHLIYFFTKNGIIYVTAYFLLFRLWKPIWTDRIWVRHLKSKAPQKDIKLPICSQVAFDW